MRSTRTSTLLAGLALATLGACQSLPPDAIVGDRSSATKAGTAIGNNQVGEPCEYRPDSLRGVDLDAGRALGLWCGTWRQPSGHVFEEREARKDIAALDALANASLWRTYLNQRSNCGAAANTSILDGVPAVLMQCTEHNGGWPHVALAATIGGKTFMADAVPSAMPAIEAALANLGGRPIAQAENRSAARTLVDQRLSAQPFGSGDLDRYYGLMRLGDERNAVDDFAGAEDAFRDALAVQQRILGSNNPGLAMPLMHLALQVSNQQRFDEADGLFARAKTLLADNSDPLASAAFGYYLAIHALNQGQLAEARTQAAKAEKDYAAFVPPGLEEGERRGTPPAGGANGRNPNLGALQPLIVDPQAEGGVRGLAAVWRLESTMAYGSGGYGDAHKIANQARALLSLSGFDPPGTLPRVIRVAALSDAAIGNARSAQQELNHSAFLFDQITPNEKPVAITRFLAGRELQSQGDTGGALEQFRAGAKTLRDRHLGLPDNLVGPYLDALFAEGERNPQSAPAIHAEMFEAAQLIQGSLTAQYIAKAAARLSAGDQRVSLALRQLQEAELALKILFQERDVEAEKPATLQDGKKLAQLDAAIAEAEGKRNAAEAAAQAAAPSYGQLIQAEASSKEVIGVLRDGEAFLSFQLGQKSSFGFLVTRQGVTAYRLPHSLAAAAQAVEYLRKSAQVEVDARGAVNIPTYDVAAARKLYEELFAPIGTKLGGIERLVISSNGPLLSLPFEMLVTADTPAVAGGDYRQVPFLLKRFAVSYVPAPQTFLRLRQIKSASTAPEPYVGYGDLRRPTPAQLAASFPPDRCKTDLAELESLSDLPGTRQEIIDVGKLLGAAPENIVLAERFTKAALEQADLKRYRVVHLATHALLPTELRCLSEPSILTSLPSQAKNAGDGFLYSADILRLQMDADLVILSACNTAGPGGAAGESLSGLARAFFFAGTRGLLATHWSVDDDSAKFIITHAMGSMKPGTEHQDTTVALRDAKLERLMTAGTPGGPSLVFSHPFAWAPFVLIGDGLRVDARTAVQPDTSVAGRS